MNASFVAGALAILAVARPLLGEERKPADPQLTRAKVVFVCAHGNVKSLIAAEWFNRLAAERGVPTRAVARGLAPENPVPAAIAERLKRDGIDVTGFEARALSSADVEGTFRLVAIGVEPPAWVERSGVAVEAWDGIPPASERYEESRDAMRARMDALLRALKATTPAP
jgi:arsenate reductase (thioredoxin)